MEMQLLKDKSAIEKELGFEFIVTGYKNVNGSLVLSIEKNDDKMKKQSDIEEDIGFRILAIDRTFEGDNVNLILEGSNDEDKATVTRPMRLITREEAMKLTGIDNPRVRDYELEMELHEKLDMAYFIKELCPINGFNSLP